MPRHGPALVLALALTAVALTGCIGGQDPSGATTTRAPDQDPGPRGAPPGPAAAPIAFPLEEPVETTIWANGTFQPHQACNPAGCSTGMALHTTELTGQLPQGVPVSLQATLSFEQPVPVFAQPLDLAVVGGEATFYTFRTQSEPGSKVITTTLRSTGGPVVVEVTYRWSSGQAPQEDYSLRIDLEASPTTLPAGVPVALTGFQGSTLTLDAVGEGPVHARVYGADDAFLWEEGAEDGTIDLELPPPATQPLVLVTSEGSAPVHVLANASQARLDPLGLQVEVLEGQDVVGPETVSWTFDVTGYPLAAGLYFTESQPFMATAQPGTGALASPAGTVTDGSLGCGLCLTSGLVVTLPSQVADPALVPGTYEASYQPNASAGAQVGAYLLWYER